jgi:hypothetical protein
VTTKDSSTGNEILELIRGGGGVSRVSYFQEMLFVDRIKGAEYT